MKRSAYQCDVRLQSGWKCTGKIFLSYKPKTKRSIAAFMPKPVEQQPERILSCYLPFQPGDRVRLRLVKPRIYTVLEVQINVDLEYLSHPNPPNGESEANHYYTLSSPFGIKAYWHHSQLEAAS